MKSSLKDLAARRAVPPEPPPKPISPAANDLRQGGDTLPRYRTAQTRSDTRQVSGHFKPVVSQTLRLIAVEQDRDVQEILAEALNMVFQRYGKTTRADVTSGRRKKATT
jgi:hypothetical protein